MVPLSQTVRETIQVSNICPNPGALPEVGWAKLLCFFCCPNAPDLKIYHVHNEHHKHRNAHNCVKATPLSK